MAPFLPRAEAIAVEHVTWRARDGAALVSDASLDVAAGERLAIIGPNGAGKTTLMKLMARQLHPAAGRVLSAAFGLWLLAMIAIGLLRWRSRRVR